MGNSEVGHMNLGAGRVVYSGLSQIYHAIEDGSFFNNASFLKAVEQVKKNNATLHLMGLVSDGAVHSHQDHLYALLKLAKQNGVKNVAVHAFLDGRDTSPTDGVKYLKALQQQMDKIGVGRIASLSGRFFAMDRDKRWERVEKAFLAICGRSNHRTSDYLKYVQDGYAKGIGDEFVEPVMIADKQGDVTGITQNDAVIFFNFRADRAREITHAFVDKDFNEFNRGDFTSPAVFVCMSLYDKNIPAPVAFKPTYPQKILPEILAEHRIPQLRIAETEKYAHVTFFFNGGVPASQGMHFFWVRFIKLIILNIYFNILNCYV
jgi:2,3-bisphosphoglycerate-independent phosphoglycerate mutase